MSLKNSLGTSLQGFCHSQDSVSDGYWITSANFSSAHWRNVSHAALAVVTLVSVTDETCGLIAKTTCVRMVCAACHGRSQPLSAGSTGDLSVTLRPKALGPPVPCDHLEMSPALSGGGWMTVTLVVIFFFFLSIHSLSALLDAYMVRPLQPLHHKLQGHTINNQPKRCLCNRSFFLYCDVFLGAFPHFNRVGDSLSESWRTVCIRQDLNSPAGPGY